MDDHVAITQLLHRYAFTIDDQTWDDLLDIFTDSCRADYGQFGSFDSSQAVTDWMRDAHVGLKSHHAIANVTADVDGDRATARSYVTVTILTTTETPSMLRTGGEYRDVLTRVDGRWRIAERDYRTIWQEGSLTGS
ncbi:MAG TPA: nuclear transport factor 2 family protein [Ilumatobacteraceae bacterium]